MVFTAIKIVFSTYVEVIPIETVIVDATTGILHVCGGDPMLPESYNKVAKYSPRMWR